DAGPPAADPARGRRRLAAARARRVPAAQPQRPARAVGPAHHGRAAAHGDDRGRDLLRGHRRVRQLRRRARDGQRRDAAGLRARPLRADHPAGGGDPRGARHRPAPARRPGPGAVRQVRARRRAAHPHPRRLRAGRQPHRRDRRRELRGGARAGHPRAAGGHPRALDARPPGPRPAPHPADHRRGRPPPRPPAHRAAPLGHPGQPRPGRRHRHHGRGLHRPHRGQPPRPDRRGRPPHGRQRDHHRPVVDDRPDPRGPRGGPEHDADRRRPAGRARGGRAPARLPRGRRRGSAVGRPRRDV
ncbi:MAG: RsbT co-antagonist protein RsbRA, partial [uncultured Nocardioidaceae bacterium]